MSQVHTLRSVGEIADVEAYLGAVEALREGGSTSLVEGVRVGRELLRPAQARADVCGNRSPPKRSAAFEAGLRICM